MHRKTRRFFSFLVLLLWTEASAQLSSRNEARLGFTSNANLEAANSDSDLFYALASTNSYGFTKHTAGFRLSYRDFISQSANDLLNLKLSERYTPGGDSWDLLVDGFLAQYPQGAPAVTDVSLNHHGLSVAGEKAVAVGESGEVTLTPGYSLRRYTSIQDRTDHNFYGTVDYAHELRTGLDLGTYVELSWISSNQREYSRVDVEWGGSIDYALKEDWSLNGTLNLRRSLYLDRLTTEETIVTKKRGQAVSQVTQTNETLFYTGISVEASHALAAASRIGFGGGLGNQTSASGLQDYSVLELFGRYVIRF